MVDCDWQRLPEEVLGLPALTRLHLRFADFGAEGWLPAGAARLAPTLQCLELPGCQIRCGPVSGEALGVRRRLRFAAFSGLRGWPVRQAPASGTCRSIVMGRCAGCGSRACPALPCPPQPPLCSAVPEGLAQLSALTRLSLERNYVRQLPPSLARLSRLASLRHVPYFFFFLIFLTGQWVHAVAAAALCAGSAWP